MAAEHNAHKRNPIAVYIRGIYLINGEALNGFSEQYAILLQGTDSQNLFAGADRFAPCDKKDVFSLGQPPEGRVS